MKLFHFVLMMILLCPAAFASDNVLEEYVKAFNYDTRLEMKAGSKQLLDMLEDGKAVLVDIRFKEVQEAWEGGFCIGNSAQRAARTPG